MFSRSSPPRSAGVCGLVLGLFLLSISPAIGADLRLLLQGEAVPDYFGASVAPAGDFNGDGTVDVIVGAFGHEAHGFRTGRAYVFYLGPIADDVPDLTFTGEGSYDVFAAQVNSAGDFNADGYADLIVGAHEYNTGPGYVHIYYGGPSADNIYDLRMEGESNNLSFGAAAFGVGDFNNDGYDDVVVGASRHYSTQYQDGRAYVYYGGPNPDTVPDLWFDGLVRDGNFGLETVPGGDFNGDGHNDICIGSDAYDNTRGRAYIYFGGDNPSTTAGLIIDGPDPGGRFSSRVGGVGDVNGDGYDDLLIASANVDRTYLYYGGPGLDATPDVTYACGEPYWCYYGFWSASGGDVNGDGYDDVLIGAQGYSLASSWSGAAYLYLGGPTPDPTPVAIVTGEAAQRSLGGAVAFLEDSDGDGLDEAIIGGSGNRYILGEAYIYSFFSRPLAGGDIASTDQDIPVAINVLDNDTGAGPLTISSITQPAHGSAAIDPGNLSVTYTPALYYYGTDSFTYVCTDGIVESQPAVVDLTVVQTSGGGTPAGEDVTSAPEDPETGETPVSLTFDEVTEPGLTTLDIVDTGPPPPEALRLGTPPTYLEINTTAVYSGPIVVCFDYSSISFNREDKLKLYHREAGHWVELTTISLDTVADVICAEVASLSTFALFEEIPRGDVAGSVVGICTGQENNFEGVDVDAYADGALVGSSVTDPTGSYEITDLLEGDHVLTIVAPLGHTATVEEVPVTIVGESTVTADFSLYCIESDPRSMGFWKHQVGVATGGNGRAQIDGPTLCGHLDLIEVHFNSNNINPVQIYAPPGSGECMEKLQAARELLNLRGSAAMVDRARQHLMALLFNVAADRISLSEIISEDGATVSQAITHCDLLLDDPEPTHGECETAKSIAAWINGGQVVPAGVIPLDTANIAYKQSTPSAMTFGLKQNRPNPFNPSTAIRFTLAAESDYVLGIYDGGGRMVRTFTGRADAGETVLIWNGADDSGSPLASGVYYSMLRVGESWETRKMVLIR